MYLPVVIHSCVHLSIYLWMDISSKGKCKHKSLRNYTLLQYLKGLESEKKAKEIFKKKNYSKRLFTKSSLFYF